MEEVVLYPEAEVVVVVVAAEEGEVDMLHLQVPMVPLLN